MKTTFFSVSCRSLVTFLELSNGLLKIMDFSTSSWPCHARQTMFLLLMFLRCAVQNLISCLLVTWRSLSLTNQRNHMTLMCCGSGITLAWQTHLFRLKLKTTAKLNNYVAKPKNYLQYIQEKFMAKMSDCMKFKTDECGSNYCMEGSERYLCQADIGCNK